MKIKSEIYFALILIMIVLIFAFFGLLWKYNEARNELVADLESKGYVCQKNPFGMYKECLSPDYVENYGLNFTLNYNISEVGQNG